MKRDLRVSKSGKIIEVTSEKNTELYGTVVGYTDEHVGNKMDCPHSTGHYVKTAFVEYK